MSAFKGFIAALGAGSVIASAPAQPAEVSTAPLVTAPVRAPRTNLADVQGAPFPVFARAMENFSRDQFGIDLLVVDADRFIRPGYPGAAPYHTPERAENARADLEREYGQRLLAQVNAQAGPAQPQHMAQSEALAQAYYLSHNVANKYAEPEEREDDGVSPLPSAGTTFSTSVRPAIRQLGAYVGVIAMGSTGLPHLLPPEQRAQLMFCPKPSPYLDTVSELHRTTTGYHEIAHAVMLRQHQDAPLVSALNDREMSNYLEVAAISFSALMMIKDAGATGHAINNSDIGRHSFSQYGEGDISHYALPALERVNQLYRQNPQAIAASTPADLLEAAKDIAQETALSPADRAALIKYRDARREASSQGMPLPDHTLPALNTYERLQRQTYGLQQRADTHLHNVFPDVRSPEQRNADDASHQQCLRQQEDRILGVAALRSSGEALHSPTQKPASDPAPVPPAASSRPLQP